MGRVQEGEQLEPGHGLLRVVEGDTRVWVPAQVLPEVLVVYLAECCATGADAVVKAGPGRDLRVAEREGATYRERVIAAERLAERGQLEQAGLGLGEDARADQSPQRAQQGWRVRLGRRGQFGQPSRSVGQRIGDAKVSDRPDRERDRIVGQLSQGRNRLEACDPGDRPRPRRHAALTWTGTLT